MNHLLDLLVNHCYKTGEFTLASGQKSNEYVNLKAITLNPRYLPTVARALWDKLWYLDWDRRPLIGVPMGGIPLATATAIVTGVAPIILARQATKDHGAKQQFDGLPDDCQQVVLIEDVVTTGGSLLALATQLRAAGVKDITALAVVNRQQGGEEALAAAGVEFAWLATLEEIRQHARHSP